MSLVPLLEMVSGSSQHQIKIIISTKIIKVDLNTIQLQSTKIY